MDEKNRFPGKESGREEGVPSSRPFPFAGIILIRFEGCPGSDSQPAVRGTPNGTGLGPSSPRVKRIIRCLGRRVNALLEGLLRCA